MDDIASVKAQPRVDVGAFYLMAEAGEIAWGARIELIDGEMVDMAPIGVDHAATVNGFTKALVMACGDRAIVSVQNPVRLDQWNEPQPDFAVSRVRADHRTRHPGPSDILLLVEVSDSTLRFDRTVKLPLYARCGIPEVWIVDMQRRVLEAHRRPVDGAYQETITFQSTDTIGLALMPEIMLPLARAFD